MTDTTGKFTPGPWRTDRYKSRVLAYVRNEDGGLEPFCVADCDQSRHLDVYLGHTERQANTRLIAKALEMYKVLERLADKARDGNRVLDIAVTTWRDWCQEARRIKAEIDQEKE